MWQYIQTPDPDELYHSWTKRAHKYISRAWKKGKWVYKYPLTGKGYKEKARKEQDKDDKLRSYFYERDMERMDKAEAKAKKYEYDYYTKSLAGKLKSKLSKYERSRKYNLLDQYNESKKRYTSKYTDLLRNHENVAKVKNHHLSAFTKPKRFGTWTHIWKYYGDD